jgi:hypothetical protein
MCWWRKILWIKMHDETVKFEIWCLIEMNLPLWEGEGNKSGTFYKTMPFRESACTGFMSTETLSSLRLTIQVWCAVSFKSGLLFHNFLSKRRESVTLLFSVTTQKIWMYCYHTVSIFKMSISHCTAYHPEIIPTVLLQIFDTLRK